MPLTIDPDNTPVFMGLLPYVMNLDVPGKIKRARKSGAKGDTITYGVTHSSYDSRYNSYSVEGVEWFDEFYDELNADQRGVMTIHEALHQIPGLTDQALARAASIIDDPRNPKSFKYNEDGTTEASLYLERERSKNTVCLGS